MQEYTHTFTKTGPVTVDELAAVLDVMRGWAPGTATVRVRLTVTGKLNSITARWDPKETPASE